MLIISIISLYIIPTEKKNETRLFIFRYFVIIIFLIYYFIFALPRVGTGRTFRTT
jgi:hypothetical protein